MSLFSRKQSPQIKPASPAPAPANPLSEAETALDEATRLCLQLDQERRDWAGRREKANRQFNDVLAKYHVALDQAEKSA